MLSPTDWRSTRLREIDGWRAVSVLLVILHHVVAWKFDHVGWQLPLLGSALRNCGQLGVETFFVISGLVICRMLIAEESNNGHVSLKSFYLRRAFRILPPLVLYVSCIAALIIFGLVKERWLSLGWALLFLYDLGRVPVSWFVGHTWTLAIEEQFYLLFPSLWIVFRSHSRKKIFLLFFVLLAAWNLEAVFSSSRALFSGGVPPGFGCICCGILLAIHEKHARTAAGTVPGPVVALVGFVLLLHPVAGFNWKSALYDSLFVPPAIGLILMFSLEHGEFLRKLLISKPIQVVGITSYGFYLWQQLFTAPLNWYTGKGVIIFYLWPLMIATVAISYIFVEKPAMRFGRSYANGLKGCRDRSNTAVNRSPLPGYKPAKE